MTLACHDKVLMNFPWQYDKVLMIVTCKRSSPNDPWLCPNNSQESRQALIYDTCQVFDEPVPAEPEHCGPASAAGLLPQRHAGDVPPEGKIKPWVRSGGPFSRDKEVTAVIQHELLFFSQGVFLRWHVAFPAKIAWHSWRKTHNVDEKVASVVLSRE